MKNKLFFRIRNEETTKHCTGPSGAVDEPSVLGDAKEPEQATI